MSQCMNYMSICDTIFDRISVPISQCERSLNHKWSTSVKDYLPDKKVSSILVIEYSLDLPRCIVALLFNYHVVLI